MDAKRFILAGNARFTVKNTMTGNRFTFHVRKPDKSKPHFVKLLTGSDNSRDYTFLGTIFNERTYRHGRRSSVGEDAMSNRAFAYVWGLLANGEDIPGSVEIYHEGRCGRCGRRLTVPESVISGFGALCRGLV
jgi:hypothetical protein